VARVSRRLLPLLATLLLAAAPAAAAELTGVVVRVVDGDTIHVRLGDRVEVLLVEHLEHHPSDAERVPATEVLDDVGG